MDTTTRRLAWAFVAAAVVAVVVGTIANGFYGLDWFFNFDNVVDALPQALPFLISAGVIAGQDRWAAGRIWLIVGAWLVAIDGVLAVLLQLQVAQVNNDVGGVLEAQPLLLIRGLAGALAHFLGFGSLAAGLWLSRAEGWSGVRRAAAIGLAVAIVLAAAGPFAAFTQDYISWTNVVAVVGQVPFTLGLLAIGALAIAALRAAPQGRPALPEFLIAGGAVTNVIAVGATWWLFYSAPGEIYPYPSLSAVGRIALLVVAVGFWSATLFWPMADESIAATE